MGRPKSSHPTDTELELLRHIWNRGTATVRDISDDLTKTKKVAYTSIATIVRIMVEKGTVEIVDERRPQKFKAVISERDARKAVTDAWLDRLFEGSIVKLLAHALEGRKVSPADKKAMKALIDGGR